jgi:group I intron endonuclease
MKSGIYCLIWKLENITYQYYGSAINLKKRKAEHFNSMKKGNHKNNRIQNIFNKYGSPDFKIIEFSEAEKNILLKREQWFLNLHYGKNYCLNIAKVAGNTLGVKLSQDTKNKLSVINKGKKHSELTKIKMSIAQLGLKRKPFNEWVFKNERKAKDILNLPLDEQQIIVYNHWLKTTTSKLSSVELNIDSKNMKFIQKLAKKLKVDKDAVIGYALLKHLERLSCESTSTETCTMKTTPKPKQRPKKSSKISKSKTTPRKRE